MMLLEAIRELRRLTDRLERVGSIGPDYDKFTYTISLNVFAGDKLPARPLPAEHEAVQAHVRELEADQSFHHPGAPWASSHTRMDRSVIVAIYHAEPVPPTHQGDSQ